MKFIDFFSGIGGFRLGLEMAGHTCVGHCEIDECADKSYRAMHDVKESEWFARDITTVEPADLPEADIYCGGFPCQSFSIAGKRGGFEDSRGTLFFEVMRLARVRKPKYLFLENVKGLLSHDSGNTFWTILNTFWECGYDVEYQILNSKNHGVPQNRERVFIVGHLGGFRGGQVFPIGESDTTFDDADEIKIKQVAQLEGNYEKTGRVYSGEGISPTISARDYKGAAKIAVPEIKQIGNIAPTATRDNPNQGRVYDKNGIAPCLNKMEGGGREPKIIVELNPRKADGTQTYQQDRIYDSNGIIPAICKGKSDLQIAIPVLTPDRAEKRQNGRRFKEDGEPMFTLTGQDKHGVMVSGMYAHNSEAFGHKPMPGLSRTLKANKHDASVTDGVRIRRLTPRECFRLQGFPDEYFDRAKAVNSDSQLYKQAGNSVTATVIYAIAQRLNEIKKGE